MKDSSGKNGRKLFGPPQGHRSSATRDEDLVLFKEIHTREKDRLASLLLQVSEEFELTGANNRQAALFRIHSNKKSSLGLDSLSGTDKSDYDWLKTPPATPLFPSLEMEAATAPEMAVQRELPIIQPLSRFSSRSQQESKLKRNQTDPNPKTPTNNKPKPSPTPTTTKPKPNKPTTNYITPRHPDPFLKSNLSKSDPRAKPESSTTIPKSRGSVSPSPSVRSTPTNLKNGWRSPSSSRGGGRGGIITGSNTLGTTIKAGSDPRPLSVTKCRVRGRASETTPLRSPKSTKTHLSPFFGSKMVDKVMSARKYVGGDAAVKMVGGFGRHVGQTRHAGPSLLFS